MSKKLVQINVVCNGSTGRIMNQIQNEAQNQGWEAYSFYGRGKPSNENCFKIGNKFDVLFHVLITRLFDKHGHASKRATKKLVKQIEKINPDVIQLHNIHGYYLNMKILFEYLRKCNKKIVWTLHDCWAFTGHCSYFTMVQCEQWKVTCERCIQKRAYPKTIFKDASKKEYKFKKEIFTKVPNLTIVTPSKWHGELIEKSFLNEYPIKIIHNGIDTNVFDIVNDKNIKKKYGIKEEEKIILGVAAIWEERKGLNDFIELSKVINKDKRILIVGLNKEQIKKLPDNIKGIERTENIEELVKIYSIADVLYNPSREETFSLITIEAMACGTPVLAYDNSAPKELIPDFGGKIENEKTNIVKIKDVLEKIIEFKVDKKELHKYVENNFNIKNKIKEYISCYEE